MLENFKSLSLIKKILVLLFLAIELVLFVLIQITHDRTNSIICFSSISLVVVFAFINFKNDRSCILITLGLIFTLVADLFLVLLSPINQLLGMISFSIVQIIYFLKVHLEMQNKTLKMVHIIIRVVASAIMLLICWLVLKEKVDGVSLLSIFYITNMVLSIVFSIIKDKKLTLFAFALILFLMCDIVIGIQMAVGVYFNLDSSSFIYKIVFLPFNSAWCFYLPSQVLIALNLLNNRKEN